MEATEAANQALKKSKKLQLQQRPSTLLRTTAASRASAAAASEAAARRAAHSTSAGGAQARTLKKKKAATGSAASTTKKPKKANSANNMTLLREANLGKYVLCVCIRRRCGVSADAAFLLCVGRSRSCSGTRSSRPSRSLGTCRTHCDAATPRTSCRHFLAEPLRRQGPPRVIDSRHGRSTARPAQVASSVLPMGTPWSTCLQQHHHQHRQRPNTQPSSRGPRDRHQAALGIAPSRSQRRSKCRLFPRERTRAPCRYASGPSLSTAEPHGEVHACLGLTNLLAASYDSPVADHGGPGCSCRRG
jgi:hypothetical protein